MRVKRSNLAFPNEIATHLSGARNDRMGKGVHSLNRNLGPIKKDLITLKRCDKDNHCLILCPRSSTVELLICNQRVGGSNPSVGSRVFSCRVTIETEWNCQQMRPLDTSPDAEKVQIEIFQRMEPEKRLQSAALLSETCHILLAEGIRKRHPNYNEEQIRLAVIRCLLPEDLFLQAYPSASDILP